MLTNARNKVAVLAMAAVLALQGCAFFGLVAETPAQAYFEAKGRWVAVVEAATTWALSPPGQRHPEVISRIVSVEARANGVITEIDVVMCYYGAPTPMDPTPPPSPSCVPLVGSAADSKFQFAGQLLLAAASEVRKLHPELDE